MSPGSWLALPSPSPMSAKLAARCLTPATSASIRSAISLTCAAPLVLVIVAAVSRSPAFMARITSARIGCQSRIAFRVVVKLFLITQKTLLGDGHGGEHLLFRRIHRLGRAVDAGGILSERHVLHGAVHGDDTGVRFQHRSRHGQGMLVEILGQPADRLKLVEGDQAEQTGECEDGAEPRQKTGQQSWCSSISCRLPPGGIRPKPAWFGLGTLDSECAAEMLRISLMWLNQRDFHAPRTAYRRAMSRRIKFVVERNQFVAHGHRRPGFVVEGIRRIGAAVPEPDRQVAGQLEAGPYVARDGVYQPGFVQQ